MKVLIAALLLAFTFHPLNAADIPPIKRALTVASNEELESWHYSFNSLKQLEALLGQNGNVVLTSVETPDACIAVIRNGDSVLVTAVPRNLPSFTQSGGTIRGSDAAAVNPQDWKLVPIVETDVTGPTIDGATHSRPRIPLYAFQFHLDPAYKGSLSLNFDYGTDTQRRIVVFRSQILWQ